MTRDLERSSRSPEARFGATLGPAPVAALLTDAAGHVLIGNRACCRLLARTEQSLLGSTFESLLHPLDRCHETEQLGLLLTGVQASYRCRHRVDAGGRWMEADIDAWIVEPAGIEDEPLVARLIQPAEPPAEHVGETGLSTMVSTVSHELLTPLAIIVGYSEILLTRKVDEAKAKEALERINGSAKRLSRLIDDLLSLSRIESGRLVVRPEALDLRALVDEVVAPLAAGREFVLAIPVDLPPVQADRDLLVQILTNLAANAVKYSEAPVTVSAAPEEDRVVVSVADRGVGISERELPQLFSRFFRSERPEVRKVMGTGLGLLITKSLVELLGGEIGVESTVDVGTTFRVALPIAPPTP